eukprot:9201531-Heterocapsa_arctica.AAC.1
MQEKLQRNVQASWNGGLGEALEEIEEIMRNNTTMLKNSRFQRGEPTKQRNKGSAISTGD